MGNEKTCILVLLVGISLWNSDVVVANPQDNAADAPDKAARAAERAGGPTNRAGLPNKVEAEVIVTGTYIRGNQPASPVFVFGREDFESVGAVTTEQFLATIPQNFLGGPAEGTTNNTVNSPFWESNPSMGTGVNLRGLGAGATLVLIDGKRTAVAGGRAEFVDVSLIPLAAVERIEIMTDGASAAYGADAVGGVVNFIMRRDYEGAETTGKYGTPTRSGGGAETHAGQSAGFSWGTGGVLLSADFYEHTALSTLDRDFSRDTNTLFDGPRDLLPAQHRLSGYLGAQQDLSDSARLSLSALFSERDAYYDDFDPAVDLLVYEDATAVQSAVSMGYEQRLGDNWQADLTGGASRNRQVRWSAEVNEVDTENGDQYDLRSVDATLRGDLMKLPAGALRVAVGASLRSEEHEGWNITQVSPVSRVRTNDPVQTADVRAAFAEVLVPLFSGDTTTQARVLLSVAGRYEEYSNFGSSFNPKYGVRWQPHKDVALRATFGTSFKAPTLPQLDDNGGARNIPNVLDPTSPTGRTRSILRTGRKAELDPQTASSLSAGIDWAPSWIPGFRSELTYFDVDYENRIATPNVATAVHLNDPAWADTVIRRGEIPDAEFDAMVVDILTNSGRSPVGGCNPPSTTPVCNEPPGNILAIIDRRTTNISATHTRGLDWTISQDLDTSLGDWHLGANAMYLLENSRQVSSRAPTFSILNRVLNPVDLRLRGTLGWSRGGWSVNSFINYTDNYDNEGGAVPGTTLAPAAIDSWMTVDLGIAYTNRERTGWLGGLRLALHAMNVTDEDPPYYDDGFVGLGFDPANANPMGRILSVTVSKTW